MLKRLIALCTLVHLLALPVYAATPELCGDGIDNDSSGGDLDCPGDDKDNDGYRDVAVGGADCDDNNNKIFPGEVVAGDDAYDWKTCQADGTYSANNAATDSSGFYAPGVNNYYICQTGGNDGNAGTSPATCFATSAPILRSGGSPYAAGDYIFLVGDGTYSWTAITDGGYTSLFPFRIEDGTAEAPVTLMAYPGDTVTLDAGCSSGTPCDVVTMDTAEYIHVKNVGITGGYGFGVATEDAAGIEIHTSTIYDNDGPATAGTNMSGVRFTRCSTGCKIMRSFLYDNFKTTGTANENENAANLTVFDAEVDALYNRMGYTLATSGGYNIKYKHARDPGYNQREVAHNILYNAELANIGTGSPLHIHHNQILASTYAGIQIENLTGETKTGDVLIEYNSMSGMPLGFRIRLDETYTPIDDITIRYNSIVGTGTHDLIELDRYSSTFVDELFTDHWFVNDNCYWDSGGTENWSVAKSDSGDEYGTFAAWQAAELLGSATAVGHDADSYFETPNYTAGYVAQAANCADKHWRSTIAYLDSILIGPTTPIDTIITKRRKLR